MKKINFSHEQIARSSEIFGNLAVAWFSAGVISPLFVRPIVIYDFVITSVLSLIFALFFFILSLYIIKKLK